MNTGISHITSENKHTKDNLIMEDNTLNKYPAESGLEFLLLLSTSPASSSGSPEFLIPQLTVFKDKVTGRRPKLMANDNLTARG